MKNLKIAGHFDRMNGLIAMNDEKSVRLGKIALYSKANFRTPEKISPLLSAQGGFVCRNDLNTLLFN